MTRRRAWWLVATLLFVLTFAKGMVWVSIVPIAQQPDEPAHAAYSDDMARTWHVSTGPRTPSRAMETVVDAASFHRMVFRSWSIGSMDDVSLDAREDRMRTTAGDLRREIGDYSATAEVYPPLYYVMSAAAVRATSDDRYDRSWLAQRMVSVLLASITSIVHLAIMSVVFVGLARAGLAALTITLMPMYTSVESAINPEVLLTLLGSVSLLLTLLVAQRPLLIRWHVLQGVTLALLLLTKPNGIVFVIPYVVAAVTGVRRTAEDHRFRRLARMVVASLAPLAVIYGAWRLVPARTDGEGGGDPLALLPEATWTFETISAYASFVGREGRYRILDSYWGTFGWVDAAMPSWTMALGAAFVVFVGAVLLIRALEQGVPWWMLPLGSAIVGVLLMLFWVEFHIVTTTGTGMIQGRYFFSVVAAIVAIQFWAVDQAFRSRRRIRQVAWIAMPAFAAAMHVVAVVGVVVPRYYL